MGSLVHMPRLSAGVKMRTGIGDAGPGIVMSMTSTLTCGSQRESGSKSFVRSRAPCGVSLSIGGVSISLTRSRNSAESGSINWASTQLNSTSRRRFDGRRGAAVDLDGRGLLLEVTGDQVPRRDLLERGVYLRADALHVRAPRVEPASGGRVDGARDLALDLDVQEVPLPRVGDWRRVHQGDRVR